MTKQTIIPPSAVMDGTAVYASFMDRFIALLIDYIVLTVIQFVILSPILALLFDVAGELLAKTAASSVWSLSIIIYWLYFAGLESSKYGATLGKRAMNLRVVNEDGVRVSFGYASLRHFFKFVSAFPLLLGFIMAIFTKRKQALHDLVAQTLVLSS